MSRPRFLLPLAVLLAVGPVLTLPHAALAEPTPSEIGVARRLFEEGKAAEDAQRYHDAAEKFRKAIAIKDTPGIRFHLARCEEEQGAYVEALVEYDRARELIEGGTKAVDVQKLLPAARERVRAKVALLTLRLPDAAKNASVQLDGKALSSSVLGQAMPINPGRHRLTASAAGRTSFSGALDLSAGESRQLLIELPPAAGQPPSTPVKGPAAAPAVAPTVGPTAQLATEDASVPTRTLVLIGEGSLFAAGLATGIIFTIAKGSAEDRYDAANAKVLASGDDMNGSACSGPEPREGCADLADAQSDRSRASQLSTAGFIAAGASAAAFGLTLWLWPHAASAARVQARAGAGGASLALSGQF